MNRSSIVRPFEVCRASTPCIFLLTMRELTERRELLLKEEMKIKFSLSPRSPESDK